MKELKLILNKYKDLINNIKQHNISGYSAQSAYYIILSFIPFVIILLSLIQYLGIDNKDLYFIIKTIIPTSMNETILGIIQEVNSKSISTISVSILFVIWSSGKGFYSLYKGLEIIYENKKKTPYIALKLRTIIYTFFFTLLIIAALILMVFGKTLSDFIKQRFPSIDIFEGLFRIKDLLVVIGLFTFLLLIYKFVPKSKNKFKNQIPGAIIASIGWIIISKIFTIYLSVFTGFSVIYGSLTTIILIMMWVYLCIYIILLGAEINNYIHRNQKY